ncbi:hypothetical protein HPB50_016026 [Hyalomma asiaticum]|uniref:Uncharacterized protein n=1 Tax=Hyalomma asiaticum TaxID=266040 RepID=A0ACB7TA03_HYAAI|nr:hypothetical protein HPB50_016026 [Hyalomma asiaticum]
MLLVRPRTEMGVRDEAVSRRDELAHCAIDPTSQMAKSLKASCNSNNIPSANLSRVLAPVEPAPHGAQTPQHTEFTLSLVVVEDRFDTVQA